MESKIFTPVKIGPVELRNRVIRSAAFENMAYGNKPSKDLFDYHTAVARGGVGMTTVAYAAVSRSGLSFNGQLWMREEIVPELKKLTDSVHSYGAKASIQLGHCGNMTHRATCGCMLILRKKSLAPDQPEQKALPLPACFATAFAAAIANPSTILSFFAAFAVLGIGSNLTAAEGAFLIAGILLGTGCWWALLSALAARFRSRVTQKAGKILNLILGTLMLLFGIMMALQAFSFYSLLCFKSI